MHGLDSDLNAIIIHLYNEGKKTDPPISLPLSQCKNPDVSNDHRMTVTRLQKNSTYYLLNSENTALWLCGSCDRDQILRLTHGGSRRLNVR